MSLFKILMFVPLIGIIYGSGKIDMTAGLFSIFKKPKIYTKEVIKEFDLSKVKKIKIKTYGVPIFIRKGSQLNTVRVKVKRSYESTNEKVANKLLEKSIIVENKNGELTISPNEVPAREWPKQIICASFSDIEVFMGKEISRDIDISVFGSIRINIEGPIAPNTNIRIEDEFGDIRIEIPKDSSVEVEAKTGYGEIETDLPFKVLSKSEGYFHGKLGEGKAKLYIESGSGDITIE